MHPTIPIYLLARPPDPDATPPGLLGVLIASGAVLVVVILAMVVVARVKRRFQEPDEPAAAGFTLSDLRQLHKAGQMTDEEFDRAKGRVVEAARKAAEREQSRRAGADKNLSA